MDLSGIEQGATKAAVVLAHWALVVLVYRVARWVTLYARTQHPSMNRLPGRIFAYAFCAALITFYSWYSWHSYGTRTENDDPLFASGDVAQDIEPTDSQRDVHAISIGLMLFLPAAFGVRAAFNAEGPSTAALRV